MAYRTKRRASARKSYSRKPAPRRRAPARKASSRGRSSGTQTIKIVLQTPQQAFDPANQMARDLGLTVEPSTPRRAPF